MLKKCSIRVRLTLLSVLLLSVCCVVLTVILNFSALRMADVIEATPVLPATASLEGEPPTQTAALLLSAQAKAARYQFKCGSIFYMVLMIGIGGGLTYYLTGNALRPLQTLCAQMKNQTVNTLLQALPVPQSGDEIADLTKSFNQMSCKLEEAFAMQKRFSQSAAHELRTPLAVLKTKVDVFQKKETHTKGEYEALFAVITAQTNRLTRLIKELLDLTNTQALHGEERFEMKALLAEIVQELAPIAQEKQVTVSLCGQPHETSGNKALLDRAFYNLVENAILYNEGGGQVMITVSQEGCIEVKDTGIGVPRAAQELIFEPFFRVDTSRSRQNGGAGLGLATVKAIIEKHHGTIEVTSDGSSGTRFQVKLK